MPREGGRPKYAIQRIGDLVTAETGYDEEGGGWRGEKHVNVLKRRCQGF